VIPTSFCEKLPRRAYRIRMSLLSKLSWHWQNFKRTRLAKPVLFEEGDFENRQAFREDYRRIAEYLAETFPFQSVMDVGCANGFLVEALVDAGKDARGIEISEAAQKVLPEAIRARVDIMDFKNLKGKYDFVTCIEVAEHIPPYRSEELVQKLTAAAHTQILFTAAGPGQPGHGHINCRPHTDWQKMFSNEGWHRDEKASNCLCAMLKSLRTVTWLHYNAVLLAPEK